MELKKYIGSWSIEYKDYNGPFMSSNINNYNGFGITTDDYIELLKTVDPEFLFERGDWVSRHFKIKIPNGVSVILNGLRIEAFEYHTSYGQTTYCKISLANSNKNLTLFEKMQLF